MLIANALSNAVAGGTGALTDLVMGGNGGNGASLGAIMQAYNQANDPNGDKVDKSTQQILDNLYDWSLRTMEAASYFPVIGDPASFILSAMYAVTGDYENASLNFAAGVLGAFVLGEGKPLIKGGAATAGVVAGKHNTTIIIEGSTKDGSPVYTIVQHNGKIEGEAIISPENQKYVDILSPEAKQHILYGDKPGSGGHLYPGQKGKTVFPESWSADKVVHEIGDIVTSPNTKWYAQTGTGDIYTKAGLPARWAAYEVRDGVRIRVIYEPATNKVITAFPDNSRIPSNYKSVTK